MAMCGHVPNVEVPTFTFVVVYVCLQNVHNIVNSGAHLNVLALNTNVGPEVDILWN